MLHLYEWKLFAYFHVPTIRSFILYGKFSCKFTINTYSISSYTNKRKNMFSLIYKISPFVIIPYMLVALFVISYIACLKYLVRKEIQKLPTAIYGIDVNNLRKNLQIKSMVYNFILIISIIEFVSNVVLETDSLIITAIDPEDSWINLSSSCHMEDFSLKILGIGSTFIYSRTRNITEVTFSELPILMALFYIILRRMYLNVPYHRHIRKYIIYIVIQFVVKCVFVSFMQTFYFGVLLYLPFLLIDFVIYICASQKFYNLLKGMRNAASLHSSNSDFFQKKQTVRRFFYARLAMIVLFLLNLIIALAVFIEATIQILTSCFLSYITSDYIPSIALSDQAKEFIEDISHICYLTQIFFLFILELITIAIYLALCVDIILIAVRKRRRYNSSNFLTRPLMENYKRSLLR